MQRFRVAGGAAFAGVTDGVVITILDGVQTGKGLRLLRQSIGNALGHLARASVVDYSESVLLLDPEELAPVINDPWAHLPSAVVVRPSMRPMMIAQSRHAAAEGIVRRVFGELDQALAWAHRQTVLPPPRIA